MMSECWMVVKYILKVMCGLVNVLWMLNGCRVYMESNGWFGECFVNVEWSGECRIVNNEYWLMYFEWM